MASPAPLSPLWWATRLQLALRYRSRQLDRLEDYYRGRHDLPEVPDQLRAEVERFLRKCSSNYCAKVVQSSVERMEIVGFRIPTDDEDQGRPAGAPLNDAEKLAWQLWQSSNMDAEQYLAFNDMDRLGVGYLLAGPDGVTRESPWQAIVEYAPGSSRQVDAGIKVWIDDRLNLLNATLYLPDAIYKWEGPKSSAPSRWTPRIPRDADGNPSEDGQVVGGAWVVENPLGRVPLHELRNDGTGVSDLDDVLPIQDRLNLTLVDRMLSQTQSSFPQRFVADWPLDEELEFDDQGNPAPVELEVGRSRLMRFPDGAKPGTFAIGPIEPYLAAKTSDVKDIASLKSIPPQYLLGDLVNVAAEGMQTAESGLVSRVTLKMRFAEDAVESAMVDTLELAGTSVPSTVVTLWRDPQFRSIAQLTDAVVKQVQAGLISREEGLRKLGYSPQEIERMSGEQRAAADTSGTAQLLSLLDTGAANTPTPPPTPPGVPNAA